MTDHSKPLFKKTMRVSIDVTVTQKHLDVEGCVRGNAEFDRTPEEMAWRRTDAQAQRDLLEALLDNPKQLELYLKTYALFEIEATGTPVLIEKVLGKEPNEAELFGPLHASLPDESREYFEETEGEVYYEIWDNREVTIDRVSIEEISPTGEADVTA